MKKIAVLAVVLFGVMSAQPALAKKPPSFALWSARESNYTDALFAQASDGGDVLIALPKAKAHWQRGVAIVAKGQTPACRKAIHAYYLAALKYFNAETIYVRAHTSMKVLAVASALSSDEPYQTLNAVKQEMKSRAVRVCG